MDGAGQEARISGRSRHRSAQVAALLQLPLLLACASAQAQPVLIVFTGTHADPSYLAQHMDWVEARPVDGVVVNDYLGRNLLRTSLKSDTPQALDASGAVTYAAAAAGLSPLKGAFRKFHHNFVRVNLSLIGPPPLLTDEAGWQVVDASAANYARAVQDTGLEGVFFDNEAYLHPPLAGHPNGADYWRYEDQLALAGERPSAMSQAAMLDLARRRGRELMQAFVRGYPGIVMIVAHSPVEGCRAWQAASGHFAVQNYLLGPFAAGMVEGTSGAARFVDGGEDYDWRSPRDFELAKTWRNGSASPGVTNCPFMDAALAASWPQKVSIAFSTFDKERASLTTNTWTPITNVPAFQSVLTNALRATDQYVWHYAEWQDWWGNDTESALQPWLQAISAARQQVGMAAPQP